MHLTARGAEEGEVQGQEGADAALLEVQREAVRRVRLRRLPVSGHGPHATCDKRGVPRGSQCEPESTTVLWFLHPNQHSRLEEGYDQPRTTECKHIAGMRGMLACRTQLCTLGLADIRCQSGNLPHCSTHFVWLCCEYSPSMLASEQTPS